MTTLTLIGLPLADMMGGWGWAWMAPMMLVMVLFWGAIIFGFVWLVRRAVEPWQQRAEETALTLLDRRFAEGALSADEYHQRRNVLAGAKPPRPDEDASSPASEGV